ncbi:MAG: hypothetical protein WCF26_07580 [Candidatus Sulfotelmatobacter sp.]
MSPVVKAPSKISAAVEEQIIAIRKQGEAGLATAELCRQHAITEQAVRRQAFFPVNDN